MMTMKMTTTILSLRLLLFVFKGVSLPNKGVEVIDRRLSTFIKKQKSLKRLKNEAVTSISNAVTKIITGSSSLTFLEKTTLFISCRIRPTKKKASQPPKIHP